MREGVKGKWLTSTKETDLVDVGMSVLEGSAGTAQVEDVSTIVTRPSKVPMKRRIEDTDKRCSIMIYNLSTCFINSITLVKRILSYISTYSEVP